MTITAVSGPTVSFGTVLASTGDGLYGQDLEHNEQRAPVFADLGDALMDPRSAYSYQPGSGVTAHTLGFYNNVGSVDFVPATINASGFLTSTTASSGVTTFSIPSSFGVSSAGVTTTTIIAPETGKATGTLLCIDSTASYLTFGSAATMAVWNPGAGAGRNITIKPSSNGDAGNFIVVGRDIYGYKMTEALPAGTTSIAGKKAFKYIASISNCSSPTSTSVSIGFGDVYGFPLAVPYAGLNAQVILLSSVNGASAAVILPSTVNVILASTVATQTSTTPDVRGTYNSTTASNGTIRLQMIVTPAASAAAAITSTNVAPFFGATQFSSV